MILLFFFLDGEEEKIVLVLFNGEEFLMFFIDFDVDIVRINLYNLE